MFYLGGESLVLSSTSQPLHWGSYWRNLTSESITLRRNDDDPIAE
jgi:hypothetical protein